MNNVIRHLTREANNLLNEAKEEEKFYKAYYRDKIPSAKKAKVKRLLLRSRQYRKAAEKLTNYLENENKNIGENSQGKTPH